MQTMCRESIASVSEHATYRALTVPTREFPLYIRHGEQNGQVYGTPAYSSEEM